MRKELEKNEPGPTLKGAKFILKSLFLLPNLPSLCLNKLSGLFGRAKASLIYFSQIALLIFPRPGVLRQTEMWTGSAVPWVLLEEEP